MISRLSRALAALVPIIPVVFGPHHVAASFALRGMALVSTIAQQPLLTAVLVAFFAGAFAIAARLIWVPELREWRERRAARSRYVVASLDAKTARLKAQAAEYEAREMTALNRTRRRKRTLLL